MNAWVIRLKVAQLEKLIEAAKENEATQIVITEHEGKGLPDCISLVVEADE
jgi:hypothetical protein